MTNRAQGIEQIENAPVYSINKLRLCIDFSHYNTLWEANLGPLLLTWFNFNPIMDT